MDKNNITVKRTSPMPLVYEQPVKVTRLNGSVEITAMKNPVHGKKKTKKPVHHDINYPEKSVSKKPKHRSDKEFNVQRSSRNCGKLIENNLVGDDSEKHVILTYSSPMDDYNQVLIDSSRFSSKVLKYYPVDYIRIIEMGGNGGYHIHFLFKDMTGLKLHFNYDLVHEIWAKGMVFIYPIPFKNYGTYFMPNVPANDTVEGFVSSLTGETRKSYVKGERLKSYPANYRLYSYSKGIKRPTPEYMTYGEAMKLVGSVRPSVAYTSHIIKNDEGSEVKLNEVTFMRFDLDK